MPPLSASKTLKYDPRGLGKRFAWSTLRTLRTQFFLVHRHHIKIIWGQFEETFTVILFKLDTSFFLNNSTNTHRIPAKPFAMCFYSPVWHFNFLTFCTFEYLDLLRGAWDSRNNFPWMPSRYSINVIWRGFGHIWLYLPENENGFIQKTLIKNQFLEYHLSTNVDKNVIYSHWWGSRSLFRYILSE